MWWARRYQASYPVPVTGLVNVATYSHANECSERFYCFRIYCDMLWVLFFVESCLFSVELSCVCYHMFYNLQCRGRAVTNVRTCGPTPLPYYKEQLNMFKLAVNLGLLTGVWYYYNSIELHLWKWYKAVAWKHSLKMIGYIQKLAVITTFDWWNDVTEPHHNA